MYKLNFRTALFLWVQLFCSSSLVGQQVFPVSVSGQLIPPNSLRINDYFTGLRDNDLMFTVSLNDPIEESRQVKIELLVESNGGVILRSDLAMAPIITLERSFPEILTGADLAPYFETLRNAGGAGVPLFLTPGLNGFCLRVIDVATEKQISNQGCAQGFFNLAQPPRLQSPTCGTEIEQTETQNLIFNWLPMHNSSGNPVNDINYVFQLVRVPEGFQNPKDAFDAGLFVHTDDVRNMTSLLYTDAEPLLERGEQYAWRVRAQAISMAGEIIPLFDNNGYSEICTFTFLEPLEPFDPLSFSSCTGSPCNYMGYMGTDPKGEDMFTGDVVKIGYYDMVLEDISYDAANESYAGTGSIAVAFLGTSVAVSFTELKINKYDRAYGGEVKARIDNEGILPTDYVGDFQSTSASQASNNNFDDSTARELLDFFDQNPNRLVTNLTQAGAGTVTSLPIGLDVTINAIEESYIITVTDILFTPTTSKLNAVCATTLPGDGFIKFGSKGVCFRGRGLVETNPKLFLLSEVGLETTLGVPMVLEPYSSGREGTSLAWSCSGFEYLTLQGRVELDRELVLPVGGGEGPVVARFSGLADAVKNFTASIEIPAFTLPGLGDFAFDIGEGYFDYSSVAQLENVRWPTLLYIFSKARSEH